MKRRSMPSGPHRPGSLARARLLALAVVVVGATVSLGAAAPALAGIAHEFDVFKNCPYETPGVTACIYSTTTSGEFKLGNKAVPINKTVVLQGGLKQTSTELVPASNGETLSHTTLNVPGGIIGIELLGPLTEVNATAELAGTVQVNIPNQVKREGTAVSLPLKVKLENVLLGGSCYVGPFTPQLTTGTTNPPPPGTPLSGSPGTLSLTANGKLTNFDGVSLVDNTFSVPGASGCGGLLSLLIDPSVDLIVGIPASGGHNTAILNGNVQEASAAVAKSEIALPELGRCEKVTAEKVGGKAVYHGLYEDAGCTYETAHSGRYEWTPGPGAAGRFSGEGKALSLQTVGGAKVTCLASTSSGQYTGTRSATIALTLTGCQRVTGKEACQTAGAGSGEIRTGALAAELGFIKDVQGAGGLEASVGWDLKGAGAIVAASCGAGSEPLQVTGSVIAPVPADKMLASYILGFKAKAGVQAVEGFEEQPKDVLSAQFGGRSPEQAGLTMSQKILNEEKLEFKAVVE